METMMAWKDVCLPVSLSLCHPFLMVAASNHMPPLPPPRLIRQIREDYWQMGRDALEQQPHLQEFCVYVYEYHLGDRWEFWVVRGPNQTFLRRTVHNGRLEEEVRMREPHRN